MAPPLPGPGRLDPPHSTSSRPLSRLRDCGARLARSLTPVHAVCCARACARARRCAHVLSARRFAPAPGIPRLPQPTLRVRTAAERARALARAFSNAPRAPRRILRMRHKSVSELAAGGHWPADGRPGPATGRPGPDRPPAGDWPGPAGSRRAGRFECEEGCRRSGCGHSQARLT